MTSDTGAQIIDKAKEMGASMAGIANVEILKKSPSHEIIKKLSMEIDGVNPYREICDFDEIKWPAEARSALVIAVSHPQDTPKLDWWKCRKKGHSYNITKGVQNGRDSD